jgi:hypothetical protein
MIDVGATIAAKSDQLNADDLMGGPRDIVVSDVYMSGSPDQPIVIDYEGGKGRPFKPCKTMRRLLVQIWGGDGKTYIGKTLRVYRDPTVTFGAQEVGGIRISHASHIDEKKVVALTAKKGGVKKLHTVLPLNAAPKQDPKEAAVKLAGNMTAAINQADDAGYLDTILNDPNFKRDLAKLSDAYSDLASGVTAAIEGKRASFSQAGGEKQ